MNKLKKILTNKTAWVTAIVYSLLAVFLNSTEVTILPIILYWPIGLVGLLIGVLGPEFSLEVIYTLIFVSIPIVGFLIGLGIDKIKSNKKSLLGKMFRSKYALAGAIIYPLLLFVIGNQGMQGIVSVLYAPTFFLVNLMPISEFGGLYVKMMNVIIGFILGYIIERWRGK